MIKIYGSMLCPDCVQCRAELDRAGVGYTYLDFSESLIHLKEFLEIRDTAPALQAFRGTGKIGIPCIMKENGEITLDWSDFIM